MAIKLYQLLFENKEESLLDYLRNILQGSPYEGRVFLAGGAVRDEIMGKPAKDIDVVVSMPDGGIAFAEWITKKTGSYRHGTNPVIFPRFGTAKFNLRGIHHNGIDLSGVDVESVMTRGEKYEKGSRKPEVVYADLKDDAFRRDLTVNSLFKDLSTGEIKDFTGRGMEDIMNGVVRTPMEPNKTFADDPLRMLRAIRFAVKYEWKMPISLVKALKKNSSMLQNISHERIRDELDKMLMTDHPDQALKLLAFTGLNKYILPELDMCIDVSQNRYHKDDVFDHILEVVKNTPKNLTARLAALFHDIGKPQTKTGGSTDDIHFYGHEDKGAEITHIAMRRLKYPLAEIEKVSNIVQNHMRLKQAGPEGQNISDKALRKFMHDVGNNLPDALQMMQADNISHSAAAGMPNQIEFLTHRIENLQQSYAAAANQPKLPINGHDIIQILGIKPGPEIKKLLSTVQDAWYENPGLTKDDALNIIKKEYEKFAGSKTSDNDIMNQMIKNPETDNDILIKTALKYPKDHPAHKAAIIKIQQSK